MLNQTLWYRAVVQILRDQGLWPVLSTIGSRGIGGADMGRGREWAEEGEKAKCCQGMLKEILEGAAYFFIQTQFPKHYSVSTMDPLVNTLCSICKYIRFKSML